MPGSQQCGFLLGGWTCAMFKASRTSCVPFQGCPNCIRQWPESQAIRNGLRAIDRCSPRFRGGYPDGEIGQGLALGKKRLADPGETSVAFRCVFTRIEKPLYGEQVIGTGCMIGTCFAGFHHAHTPVRQVAHVDKLHRIARCSRHGYFTSLSDAIWPVGKAVGGVMRATNETGPHVENATGHSLFSSPFTQRFQGTIS